MTLEKIYFSYTNNQRLTELISRAYKTYDLTKTKFGYKATNKTTRIRYLYCQLTYADQRPQNVHKQKNPMYLEYML